MKKMFLAAMAAAMLSMPVTAFAGEAGTAQTAQAETTAPAAAAQTFTSADGVLSIELPNDKWKALQDPEKWIALSDGANMITVDHLSNGEKLPDMAVADDHYVNVFQAAYSTQNEVFIITGSVVDAAVIPDITKAILSVKVLKYDTKLAVRSEEKTEEKKEETTGSKSEYSVVPMSATMYATTGVNVRGGYSTNDEVLGGLGAGSSVTVTGKVQKNGQDYGWYQVSYDGKNGYVSAEFLTDKSAGNTTPSKSGLTFTGSAKTIYDAKGNAITIYEASDSNWYDTSGKGYYWTTDYGFEAMDGSGSYSTYKPQTGDNNVPVGSPFTVYWENGNSETLTLYSDGYYYSSGWVRYWDNGDNTFQGADGTVLLASLGGPGNAPENSGTDDTNETHLLTSVDDGSSVTVSAGGGAYFDASGTEYSWTDDAHMMDFYGNMYEVVY